MAAKNRNNPTTSKNTRSNNPRRSTPKNPSGRNSTKPTRFNDHNSNNTNYDYNSYNDNSDSYPSKESTNNASYNDNNYGYDSGNNYSKDNNRHEANEPINDPSYDDYDNNYNTGKDYGNGNNSNYNDNYDSGSNYSKGNNQYESNEPISDPPYDGYDNGKNSNTNSDYNDNYDSENNYSKDDNYRYENDQPVNDPPYDDYDRDITTRKNPSSDNSNYSNSRDGEDNYNSRSTSKQGNRSTEEYNYDVEDRHDDREISNNNSRSHHRRNSIIPMGKGMFVENLRGAEPTSDGFANRAQQNGITWIAFKGATQDARGVTHGDQNENRQITQNYIEAYRNSVDNAKVYVWGWPTANSNARQYRLFIDRMIRKAEWVNGNGIILDIEGPIRGVRATGWNRGNNTRNMRILMDYALEQAHQRNMTVAVSSFGTAVRGFPWSEMRRADFGIPQLYSPLNEIFDSNGRVKQSHRNYIRRGIDLWQDETRGFNNKVVVASATLTRGRKTATHVRNLLEITAPHLTNQSIIWWVWHGTRNRRAPMSDAKWDIIRSFNF